jgi:hypothetical protein
MIKLGILDFDTSHAVEFARRLNHRDIAEDQWVDGATVVVACPGESEMMPERIPGYAKAIAALGIPLVEQPEEMIGKVDGMLIESLGGDMHWRRARPFLEAGIPCFIDKPFACNVADARKIALLAEKSQVPVFSSSSLRYAPEVVEYVSDASNGKLHGAVVFGPALLHEGNPGFFHYGIHAVEMLYTLLGPGCRRVTCLHERDADVATGCWEDGRLGTVRGLRAGKHGYGFVAFAEEGVRSVTVGTAVIYRELLKQVVQMFATRKSPLAPAVTVEIVAFIEAACRSANNHGTTETLAL